MINAPLGPTPATLVGTRKTPEVAEIDVPTFQVPIPLRELPYASPLALVPRPAAPPLQDGSVPEPEHVEVPPTRDNPVLASPAISCIPPEPAASHVEGGGIMGEVEDEREVDLLGNLTDDPAAWERENLAGSVTLSRLIGLDRAPILRLRGHPAARLADALHYAGTLATSEVF